VNKQNGIVAYISGPFITFYDIRKDSQVKFLQNKNNKSFSSVTFSEKGGMIACGEGRFKKPEIIIYELNSDLNEKIKYVLKGHKCGIEMMEFFKNDQYLISIGNSDDNNIFIYQLLGVGNDNNYVTLFSTKFKRPILAFSVSTNFFVLGGQEFLKFWSLDEIDKKIVNKNNIELGKLREKVISSLLISDERIFGLTSDAFLIEINCSNKQITRYLHLKVNRVVIIRPIKV
jgi:WD40 repeat protein